MRKLILNIVYFLALVFFTTCDLFATNWYCNGALTTSTNTGTSWADAWESFADINWASIAAGDYLYISGGTDSCIYNEMLTITSNGTKSAVIRIMAGKYSPSPSGHSGRVIIDGDYTREQCIELGTGGYKYVKGFECREGRYRGIHINSDNVIKGITIDSCNIYDYGDQAGIKIMGFDVDSTTIKNNRVVSPFVYDGQTDGIYSQGSTRFYVYNNFIRVPNQDPVAHNDVIQGYQTDGWMIFNNILINDSVYSVEGGGIPMILGSEHNNPVIIFNNIAYMGGAWWDQGGVGMGSVMCTRWYDSDPMPPTWIFNNSFVSNGPAIRGMWWQYQAWLFNNIVAQYCKVSSREAEVLGTLDCGGMNSVGLYAIIDSVRNNLLWRDYTSSIGFSGNYRYSNGSTGGISGWSDWVSKGGTGVHADPLFETQFGNIADQGTIIPDIKSNSPAIDAGEDLTYLINQLTSAYNLPQDVIDAMSKDFYGNSRGNGSGWDIGAMEYQTGAVDTVPTFSFTALTNKELNTEYIATSPITGTDTVSHFWTTTSASFKINYNGTYNTSMKTADPDNGADTAYVKNMTGGLNSTLYRETIVGGGQSRNFDVTTKASTPSGNGGLLKFPNGHIAIQPNGRMIIIR